MNERFVEDQLVIYYQRMDTQYLVAAVTISDIVDGYLFLSDLELRAFLPFTVQKGKISINLCLRTR